MLQWGFQKSAAIGDAVDLHTLRVVVGKREKIGIRENGNLFNPAYRQFLTLTAFYLAMFLSECLCSLQAIPVLRPFVHGWF